MQRHAELDDTDPLARPHAHTAERVLDALHASRHGLDAAEAGRRLLRDGPNRLPAPPRRGALRRLLAQFDNLLIYVLVGAGAVTAALGHGADAAVIAAVVIVNALIGFVQEGRAEQALEAISAMMTRHASVLRDGKRRTVDAADLVRGDVVLLEPGDRVPADLRLLHSRHLKIDEAILTGESIVADKHGDPVASDAALGDRHCMAYAGTLVATGQAAGVVVATAAATEVGRITGLLDAVPQLATPLLRQMNRLAARLTVAILGVAAAVFAFAIVVHRVPWEHAFMAVVGLAVAAIPEGLPAVMTITLAIGVRRMARRHAIIRRLPAVETLGAVTVICTDKTGTLTRNEMLVVRAITDEGAYAIVGEGYAPRGEVTRDGVVVREVPATLAEMARAAALCNDAALHEGPRGWTVDGDPMEGALLAFAGKTGFAAAALAQRAPRLDEIPFDARHRFMATLHDETSRDDSSHDPPCDVPSRRDGTRRVVYLKGAPEPVLARCTHVHTGDGEQPLDHERWERAVHEAAARGERVLAFAMRSASDSGSASGGVALTHDDVSGGLVLLGMVGMIDPPREEARAALDECRTAGITVKMITGDHAATAAAIARDLGIGVPPVRVVAGDEIERADDETLRAIVAPAAVFARASPEHKLRIVRALQRDRAVVAMTGDGVNDAPSLKQADVGVAMGRKGTEAAKEAAEMVLADDNFASIVAAVREGRTVYDNLRKVIAWTLPTNGGEALSVIVALMFGLALPIAPVQILWLNMVTAVALGLPLAFEPAEDNVMRRPPRAPDAPIIDRFLLWRVGVVSLLFATGAYASYAWALATGSSPEGAQTVVVNAMVAMEVAYLFNVRYLHARSLTWRGALGTRAVLAGIALVTIAQLVFTYLPPIQALFGTEPLPVTHLAFALGVGATLFVLFELEKRVRRRWLGPAEARPAARPG